MAFLKKFVVLMVVVNTGRHNGRDASDFIRQFV